jgi:hypothetical protein
MIVMMDTTTDLDECARELGGLEVEQLFTPLTRYNAQRPDDHFAMDNGAFSRFNANGFRSMLRKHSARKHLCRFVSVPDVVGDARRTHEVFMRWHKRDELCDWPLAYVVQDGQQDVEIPWDSIAAIFVGGSTAWKEGPHARACIKAAQALEKWVHIGRINTPARYEYFDDMGADSCDGTGLAKYSHMRAAIYQAVTEPKLELTST